MLYYIILFLQYTLFYTKSGVLKMSVTTLIILAIIFFAVSFPVLRYVFKELESKNPSLLALVIAIIITIINIIGIMLKLYKILFR